MNLAEIKRQALMGSQYVAANVVTNGELVELIEELERLRAVMSGPEVEEAECECGMMLWFRRGFWVDCCQETRTGPHIHQPKTLAAPKNLALSLREMSAAHTACVALIQEAIRRGQLE